ncbi:MAG: GNAT family N-acetyltransferase [Anaeroplasmataceae bacterium]|nr:GNAT family N-acetyltransferase [Anaeroplasmataceae bacterium]
MRIRDLKLEDFDEVNTLFMQLHNLFVEQRPDLYRKIEKPTTSKAWDFEASLFDTSKIMLGAEMDGKIVGFGIIQIRQTESKLQTPRIFAYFENIAVDEQYRRKGIGTALYQAGVNRAKALGATSMELKVWNFNAGAISFYHSLGMIVQNFILEQKL